jgi:hypothetical protein
MAKILNPFKAVKHKFFADHDAKGYGDIETGWLHYITIRMCLPLVVLAGLIAANFHIFMEYYHAAKTLNSVIFVSFFFALYKGFNNNVQIRKAAVFLKHVDRVIRRGTATPQEIDLLLIRLKTQGKLMNISDMYAAVRNIEILGHPNFTDKNAKLIKSKLGFRIGEARKGVGFVGGLLVMLGLIGTYLGLLETVDTVGAVMTKMSNIGGDSGGDGMSTFISELAQPLQGMALAFSASLFGIAGSVFISVFGAAGAHAQNDFIENVSRWIDDRIPRIDMSSDEKQKTLKLPATDDLKAWLAGFVNLSIQTNRKLGQLLYAFSKSHQSSTQSIEILQKMVVAQNNTNELAKSVRSSVDQLAEQHRLQEQQADKTDAALSQVQNDIRGLTQTVAGLNSLKADVLDLGQATQSGLGHLEQQLVAHKQDSQSIKSLVADLPGALKSLTEAQNRTEATLAALPTVEHHADQDLSAIVMQLNMLMEEMNARNVEIFKGVYPDDGHTEATI